MLHSAPMNALTNTASAPIHSLVLVLAANAFSPSVIATPTMLSATPSDLAAVIRSRPKAAARSMVNSGNVAKISAPRAAVP